ncbi:MAG: hypothetical protein J1F12_01185 [Muribaculaceae bacterium]|nr:hypothetical protein [Muribaculaceae bacterium]
MRKLYFTALFAILLGMAGIKAQVTTEPTPLQEDSQDVVIYYHADEGNKGLMGVKPPTRVFAHTGVTINGVKWQYAPEWGDNSDKYELEWVSDNLWMLPIGNLRTYYGVKDNETIEELAFVFRTEDKSKEGKTAAGGDIFVPVVDAGLQINLSANINGELINSETGPVTFTVNCTMEATLTLSINGKEVESKENVKSLSYTYSFDETGDYLVTATATVNDQQESVSINYAYLAAAQEKPYPGNDGVPVMGPVTNNDGSVTFCVAAPGMENMVIIGSWNNYAVSTSQQMYYTDFETANPVTGETGIFRYFWTTIDNLGNTNDPYIYFFSVNGKAENQNGNSISINSRTCDPYARLVLDPWNDKYLATDVYPNLPEYPYDVIDGVPVAVYQKNFNDYNWKVKDFELPNPADLIIYELLFRDFTGTEGKALGNGTVQKAMEKIDYLKRLGVNAIELLPICEFNGNQSWGYNPNFYFAIDKAYGTAEDYKAFIDLCHENGMAVILDMVFNQSDGLHPWYQMYGGPQYSPFYNVDAPHAYSVLNDWNQGYPLVQQQWTDVIEYWLTEFNFDGFRFDLVKGLGLNDSYPNNGDAATNQYNASRVAEMAYLNSVIQNVKPGAYCINENLATAKEENEMAEDGELNWLNMNVPACEYAMGWPERSGLNALYAPDASRTWGSTVSYLESHDEQRLAYKQNMWAAEGIIGNDEVSCQRLGSTAAQMIMCPGSHMIWMFSELGNAQNTKNNNDDGNNTDPKIVNWSLYSNPDHKGLYYSYSEMIQIRLKNAEMFTEEAGFKMACNASDWKDGRYLISTLGDKELFTLINPNITGDITMNVSFQNKDNSLYEILSKSYNSEPSYDAVAGTVTIPANCYVVIGSVGLEEAGIENISVSGSENTLRVRGGYGEVIVDHASEGAVVYTLDGRVAGRVAESGVVKASRGIYIVKSGRNTRKVVVK